MTEIKIFDFLNSINHSKEDLMTEDNQNVYAAYVINHFLSGTMDTVMYANEMNTRLFLDTQMQYDYLRNSVRPKKRFSKWLKKEKQEKVELLKKFFGYNTRRAEEVSEIISDDQLKEIENSMCTGG